MNADAANKKNDKWEMLNDKYMEKGGLGRGLSSLIPNKNQSTQTASQPIITDNREAEKIEMEAEKIEPDASAPIIPDPIIPDSQEMVYQISTAKIKPNPLQPRRDFDERAMSELVGSIREHGILEPLVATKESEDEYLLIAGERRLRAAKVLGLRIVPVILKTAKDLERLQLSLVENIQRRDLNPIEQAEAYAKLKDDFGLTQMELAKRVGKDRAVVANSIRLLNLRDEIKAAVASGRISECHGRTLAGLADRNKQLAIFQKILEKNLTVGQTNREIKKIAIGIPQIRMLSKDPNIAAKEKRLQEVLGTRVRIRKSGDEGMIRIEYYSDEELNGLMEKITGDKSGSLGA